jgi:hypothetical protein
VRPSRSASVMKRVLPLTVGAVMPVGGPAVQHPALAQCGSRQSSGMPRYEPRRNSASASVTLRRYKLRPRLHFVEKVSNRKHRRGKLG